MLYLYSAQVCAEVGRPWDRQILLHFVDESGTPTSYRVNDYQPALLLRPESAEQDEHDLSDILARVLKEQKKDYSEIVSALEAEQRVPVVGFTNGRSDTVYRVTVDHMYNRGVVQKAIESYNETAPEGMRLVVLHRAVNDLLYFFHTTNWRLHSWYTQMGLRVHPHAVTSISQRQLALAGGTTSMIPPVLPVLFLRIVAKSSTATRTNAFNPDHTITEDTIQCVHVCMVYLNQPDRAHCRQTFVDQDERVLLQLVSRWLHEHRPAVVVHFSDPYDHWSYLYFRMRRHGRTPTVLSTFGCQEYTNMQTEEFRDFLCPGVECVDLLCALQKFMISPVLDGFTLADAVAHPCLLRKVDTVLDVVDHTLLPLETRIQIAERDLDVIVRLEQDNGFVTNNAALSRSCDLSLTNIISRGQQTRVFSCFMRQYHQEGLYLNHDQLEESYIVVRRKRTESSFPDKPWIDNPAPDKLRCFPAPLVEQKKKKIITNNTLFSQLRWHATRTKPKKVTTKRYGGGFVIPPVPGFYREPWEAVCTLDFASLYPSIMCGYRICYMSLCYDRAWLEDPLAEKCYIPLDDETCVVLVVAYNGVRTRTVTDKLVSAVMENRKRVRKQMKAVTDPFVHNSLDAEQLSCKVLQNAFYGACGSDTFAIPCTAIAAAVCVIGQWMNKTVRYLALRKGCICVYGDTDSVMVRFSTHPGLTTREDILADIYRQARELETEATAYFPAPNAVEFEALKLPFLMTDKKKVYAAMEYPPSPGGWNATPSLLIKGFTVKKRDRCAFVQTIGNDLLLRLLADTETDQTNLAWFEARIRGVFHRPPRSPEDLGPFVISCRLNHEYKSESVVGPCLADKYEEDTGSRPIPGTRLKYVVAKYTDGRKHFKSATIPHLFLRDNMALDVGYYLSKQLLSAIKQLLNLHPVLFAKIDHFVSRFIIVHANKDSGMRSISSFLVPKRKRT